MLFSSSSSLTGALALLASSAALTSATPCPNTTEPRLGAVASEVDVCSDLGVQLLRDGGNAVDAVVGTVFCVGVIGMYHSGIGGGGFLTLRTAEGEYETVDFREKAPKAAFEDMYKDNEDASIYGGLASGVPGELKGLEFVHKKHGALPWADVLAPSIKLARYGFTVNEDLVSYFGRVSNNQFLWEDPAWAIDFAPEGKLLGLGDTMTRKRYANTLEAIAERGSDAFYTGPIANATVVALQAAGGTMTLEDLADYEVEAREPVSINYRGHKATSVGAPSSGVVGLSALKTISGYEGFDDPAQRNLSAHRLDQAFRFAYAQRAELGDPSFVDGLDDFMEQMLSDELAEEIRSKIVDDKAFGIEYYNPDGLESIDTPGTAHIATADASGMAVSLTTTVNLLFGSRLIIPETGVIMNNEMNDFSIPGKENAFGYAPSPANFVRPGKRPLSSITPIIVETKEGGLYYVIGAAGGSRIITSTIQNVINVVDRGLSVADSLAEPRLHDQLSPSVVSFEYAYDNGTTAYFESLGHNVTWVAPGQSAVQGARLLSSGIFEAAGEPRQKNSGGSVA